MRKLEFSVRQSDILFASHFLTSIRSNLANILAMFEDTNGSPFSSRTRDIRSSKTSSAIYEPGLTATIYFANLSLFITSGIRETLVHVMLSPSFVNRFHIFVPLLFSESDIARDFHNSEKLSFVLCDRAKSKTPFSYLFFSNTTNFLQICTKDLIHVLLRDNSIFANYK